MVKAKAKKAVKKNVKMKKGNKLVCEECGAVVVVEEPCTCDSCGISCCGEPMTASCCC